jgi:hypothetical protein
MKTIMVQMSDNQWTMEAMHLASALARNVGGEVVLLHLVLANNPGLLGWDIAAPTPKELRQCEVYAAVAEDYGVEFCVQPMQYISLSEALAQAVELLGVHFLFANISRSKVPFWRYFQLWNLKRQLGECHLYTLTEEAPLHFEERIVPNLMYNDGH